MYDDVLFCEQIHACFKYLDNHCLWQNIIIYNQNQTKACAGNGTRYFYIFVQSKLKFCTLLQDFAMKIQLFSIVVNAVKLFVKCNSLGVPRGFVQKNPFHTPRVSIDRNLQKEETGIKCKYH